MGEQFARVPAWIFDSPEFTAHETIVFAALCRFQNVEGTCFPSVQKLAEAAKIGKTSTCGALKGLEDKGAISRQKRWHGSVQTSSIFKIHRVRHTNSTGDRVRHTDSIEFATRTHMSSPGGQEVDHYELDQFNKGGISTRVVTPLGRIEAWAKRMADEMERERRSKNAE